MNKQLLDLLDLAKKKLLMKIKSTDISGLQISDYNKRYLLDKMLSLDSVISIYSNILYYSLKDENVEHLNRFVFVDYGGGSGLLSLLAAQVGVGIVIYTDIYDVSCSDAEALSEALDLSINHFVCGDIYELKRFVKNSGIYVDAIASYDVIEHIYDVELHFRELFTLLSINSKVVYASSANISNPLIESTLKKRQRIAEYNSQKEVWGNKKRDTLKAYFEARCDIIKNIAPNMDDNINKALAQYPLLEFSMA